MQTHGNEDSGFFFNDANTKQQQQKTFFSVDVIFACFFKKWHD